jgi:hypothetical protein
MGQYHKPVNLDRKESLNAHRFSEGIKLMEFGQSTHGTMTALALMLAGEGRWAGNRIAIVGDYAEPEDLAHAGVDATALYGTRQDYDEFYAPGMTDHEYARERGLVREDMPVDISTEVHELLIEHGVWTSPPADRYGWGDDHVAPDYAPEGPDVLVVNLDKMEALDPAGFGDDRQLGAMALGGHGSTMTALAVLLACSNGRGGGDWRGDKTLAGRWAGDRIGIVPFLGRPDDRLTDLSPVMRTAMADAHEGAYKIRTDGTVERTVPVFDY